MLKIHQLRREQLVASCNKAPYIEVPSEKLKNYDLYSGKEGWDIFHLLTGLHIHNVNLVRPNLVRISRFSTNGFNIKQDLENKRVKEIEDYIFNSIQKRTLILGGVEELQFLEKIKEAHFSSNRTFINSAHSIFQFIADRPSNPFASELVVECGDDGLPVKLHLLFSVSKRETFINLNHFGLKYPIGVPLTNLSNSYWLSYLDLKLFPSLIEKTGGLIEEYLSSPKNVADLGVHLFNQKMTFHKASPLFTDDGVTVFSKVGYMIENFESKEDETAWRDKWGIRLRKFKSFRELAKSLPDED